MEHELDLVFCPFHGDDLDSYYELKGRDPELGLFLACGHSLAEVNDWEDRQRADLGLPAIRR